jgi:hypothetical protein
MPSPKTIADIKLNLLRPALTSHFEVEIGLPNAEPGAPGFRRFLEDNGVSYNTNDQTQLRLMCSEATLPGSNLATFEINDNFHGVTERHAYRRIYDDRIDLTFYVDAENYLPIRFFETWMKYIVDESRTPQPDKGVGSEDPNYFYRVRYPEGEEGYTSQGLKVIKFERDYKQKLEYNFIKSFPISITSMPISYDSSSLLKCTVSMTYIRYVLMQESAAASQPQPNFNLTPEQLANINNQAFNPNIDLGVAPLTTGGIPFPSAQASGNNVSRAFSGASLV